MFSSMSNLQTYYDFKLDFQKVDQHTGGKWLIHGTKRNKAWNSPEEYPSQECKYEIKESESNMLNTIFKDKCSGAETSRELRICRTRYDIFIR